MQRTLLVPLVIASALGLVVPIESVQATGMFDWMTPNKWFNSGRDYDHDYYSRGYAYPGYGYGYPGYAYPGWGGYGYPGAVGYPTWGYPSYGYPQQVPQNNTQATPPTPQ